MNKLKITNRRGQNISVLFEEQANPKGLAFVMHGLGGFKEQPLIESMAQSLQNKGYSVIRFDTTNSIGESDGKFEDATLTNYYEDLEDVIKWSEQQTWYKEPFILAGHSFGGIATALFAEKYPEKVKALAPLSAVISGKLSTQSEKYAQEMEEWEKTGWLIRESKSKPGVIKKLPWSHMADRLKYDLIPNSTNLTMPVLIIVGELDNGTPPEHQKILFDLLPGKKEMHIIEGAYHNFREPDHLTHVTSLFDEWVSKV